MLAKRVDLYKSEVNAKIDPDNNTVIIEPADRIRGLGVALELSEAIQFAKIILAMEAHLQAELDERFVECKVADDIGRGESLAPYRY